MDVDTLLIEQHRKKCQKKELIGIETHQGIQKSRSEDTRVRSCDAFRHIMRSVMQQINLPVIIKIHHTSNIFVQRELQALTSLASFKTFVNIFFFTF